MGCYRFSAATGGESDSAIILANCGQRIGQSQQDQSDSCPQRVLSVRGRILVGKLTDWLTEVGDSTSSVNMSFASSKLETRLLQLHWSRIAV